MPTGYTADVATGKITTFEEYALRCARQFGATIEMRDEPLDKPIPVFEASHYNAKRLAEVRAELKRIESATDDDIAAMAMDEYQKAHKRWEERKAKKDVIRERYETMLKHARKYKPPTVEHVALAKFMIRQLTESLKWDCSTEYDSEPQPTAPETWKVQKMDELRSMESNYAKLQREENERTKSRNDWVAQLRESLSGMPA